MIEQEQFLFGSGDSFVPETKQCKVPQSKRSEQLASVPSIFPVSLPGLVRQPQSSRLLRKRVGDDGLMGIDTTASSLQSTGPDLFF
jgi:hypothetical protein